MTQTLNVKPVTHVLEDMALAHPDLPCLDFLDATLTYDEVLQAVRHAARGLQDLGVGKGMRVGLCLPNTPYYVIGYFAILMTGATVVNFNPLYTTDEIHAQIIDSGVEVMFTLDLKTIYTKVAAGRHSTALRTIIVCSLADALPPIKSLLFNLFKRAQIATPSTDLAHVPYDLLVADQGPPDPVDIDVKHDIAVIQYTGGTTGTPKGAMLTHANITANAEQVRLWLGDSTPGTDRILATIPFFHVFAMTAAMNLGLSIGAELILLPRYDLQQVLKTIATKRPTLFPAVPTIYAAVSQAENVGDYDLSSLRYCISGGAALPSETKTAFERISQSLLVEGYGLTEASPVVACNPPQGLNKSGSIGLPLPDTEVKICALEEAHKIMPPGEHGEVFVRGPQVMAGYWNNTEETNNVLQDGWLRTGDVGYRDADGYIFITDRLKDMINCSGFKVYPRMVENALYRHPAVQEAVVIGIFDPTRGEAPKAFVTLKPGLEISEEQLMAFAREHLNPIERPVALEIRSELPKTLIGKLSKKELRQEHNDKRDIHHE